MRLIRYENHYQKGETYECKIKADMLE